MIQVNLLCGQGTPPNSARREAVSLTGVSVGTMTGTVGVSVGGTGCSGVGDAQACAMNTMMTHAMDMFFMTDSFPLEDFRDFRNPGSVSLLERDLLDAPTVLAHQLLQAFEEFRADARGIVGEVDQMALAALEDLEAEFIAPMI